MRKRVKEAQSADSVLGTEREDPVAYTAEETEKVSRKIQGSGSCYELPTLNEIESCTREVGKSHAWSSSKILSIISYFLVYYGYSRSTSPY